MLSDPHPLPVHRRILGGVLHLACGLPGVALGLIMHAWQVSRGSRPLVVLGFTMLSVLVRQVPPCGAALAWLPDETVGAGAAVWSVAGGPLLAVFLVLLTWHRRRHG